MVPHAHNRGEDVSKKLDVQVLLLMVAGCLSLLLAQQQQPSALHTSSDIEIENLIIDETMTKVGRDFYDVFYSEWQAPEGVGEFQIVISERILPRIGTQVSVTVNDLVAYQSFVKPRYEEIEEAARVAISLSRQLLLNYEQIKKDIEGEEMKGTGIY